MINWIKSHARLIVIVAIILLVAGIVLKAIGKKIAGPEVTVTEAAVGALALRIAASGLVESDSADLAFQGSGRIVEVYAKEGEAITRSQLLARISPVGIMPGTLEASDVIQAPYDGTVVDIYARAGTVVAPGQPVLRIVSDRAPWVTAFIDSEDAAYIQRGQELQCRGGGYLSEAWTLRVADIGKEAVPRRDLPGSARQVRVRFSVGSPDFPLPPGTEVDIDGEVLMADDALLIPTAAVMHDGPHDRVWVVENRRVFRRDVRLGPNNFDLIQIREGLTPGDLVVVHGKSDLVECQRVASKPAPPMTGQAETGGH